MVLATSGTTWAYGFYRIYYLHGVGIFCEIFVSDVTPQLFKAKELVWVLTTQTGFSCSPKEKKEAEIWFIVLEDVHRQISHLHNSLETLFNIRLDHMSSPNIIHKTSVLLFLIEADNYLTSVINWVSYVNFWNYIGKLYPYF